MDLESYIASLRSGTPDSSGVFTLDPSASQSRFGELLKQEPALPLLRWIQACCCAQASHIRVELLRQGARLTAEGLGSSLEAWIQRAAVPGLRYWEEARLFSGLGWRRSTVILRLPEGRRLLLEGEQASWSPAGPNQPDLELVLLWEPSQSASLRARLHRELSQRLPLCSTPVTLDSKPLCLGAPELVMKPVQPPLSFGEGARRFAWLCEQTRLARQGFGMAPLAARQPLEYEIQGQRAGGEGPTSLLHLVQGCQCEIAQLNENPQRKKAEEGLQGSTAMMLIGAFCFIHPVGWVLGPAGVAQHFYYSRRKRVEPVFLDPPRDALLFPRHSASGDPECLSPLLFPWDYRMVRGWKVDRWCALPTMPGGPNLLYPYQDGLLLDPVEVPGRPLGGRCVQFFEQLETDLSGLRAVHNDRLREALGRAEAELEELLTHSQRVLTPKFAEKAELALASRQAWRAVTPSRPGN